MIQLGDEVQDVVTGFKGIAVGRTEYLNGCVRLCIQGTTLKDGIPTDSVWIDEPQLKVKSGGKVSVRRGAVGGPRTAPSNSPNPTH